MDYLLVTLGIAGIFVLALIAAIYLFFKLRIKGWHYYGLAAYIHRFPGRLTFRPAQKAGWQKGGRAEQRVEAFLAHGFEIIGHYSIEELPTARLCALRHPRTGLVGLVNEENELGTWSDVIFFPQNEPQPVLASSILKRAHFFLLPGDPKIHKPDASVSELGEAVLQSLGTNAASSPVAADSFPGLIEQAFASAIDARLLGELTDGDIRRLVKERGSCEDELDDGELAQLKKMLPLAINNELRLVCAAQFLRENSVPAAEWLHARGRLLVVHDRTPLQELAGRMIYGVFFTAALKKKLKTFRGQESPRVAFAALNAQLPASERYKKLGEVTRPVPADVYRAPIERITA